MKTNKTNIILIFSIVILAFSIGVFAYTFNVIKNKNKHISAVTLALKEKISDKENTNALEKKISELGDTHKKIGSYLVDTSNIDTFVGYLENMGINNGLLLSVKGVELTKNSKNKISVNLDMNGSFSDITKMIALLENAPYSINIDSLYLNKEISIDPETVNPKAIVAPLKSVWQANLTFTVLSL